MRKPRQMPLFRAERLGDPKDIRIFVHVCIEHVRTAREEGFPPHEIKKREQVLRQVWRALNDSRTRTRAWRQ